MKICKSCDFLKKTDFLLMFLIVFKEFLDAYESCASALRASPRWLGWQFTADSNYTVGLLLLEGGRELFGIFDTQKVYIKFKSLRVFYWDFLRNWHLYGTLIWESMSLRKTKLLMKLAGFKVSTWSQKNSEKLKIFEKF